MGKKRNREGAPEARRARRSVAARLLAAFLGLLMVGCVGVAAVAFAMPAELDGVVSLSPQTVGSLGVGGAFVSALLLVLVVSRTRRRVAEAEFSRPELISVPVSDVQEYAALFPDEGELPDAPVLPTHPAPAQASFAAPGPAGPALAALAAVAVAEPAPPLPDEVSFAPVEAAAPPAPAQPVQPSPYAELAPEPDPVAPDPAPELEAPKSGRRGRREAPVATSDLDVVSGAWFSGPSKRGRRA